MHWEMPLGDGGDAHVWSTLPADGALRTAPPRKKSLSLHRLVLPSTPNDFAHITQGGSVLPGAETFKNFLAVTIKTFLFIFVVLRVGGPAFCCQLLI